MRFEDITQEGHNRSLVKMKGEIYSNIRALSNIGGNVKMTTASSCGHQVIENSIDAIVRQILEGKLGKLKEGKIYLLVDVVNEEIIIKDNGGGLTKSNHRAFSSYKESDKKNSTGMIGRMGTGRLFPFALGPENIDDCKIKITVISKNDEYDSAQKMCVDLDKLVARIYDPKSDEQDTDDISYIGEDYTTYIKITGLDRSRMMEMVNESSSRYSQRASFIERVKNDLSLAIDDEYKPWITFAYHIKEEDGIQKTKLESLISPNDKYYLRKGHEIQYTDKNGDSVNEQIWFKAGYCKNNDHDYYGYSRIGSIKDIIKCVDDWNVKYPELSNLRQYEGRIELHAPFFNQYVAQDRSSLRRDVIFSDTINTILAHLNSFAGQLINMVMEESSDDEQKEIEEIFDLIEMPDDLERFDDAGNIEELKISFQVNTPDINLDIGEKKKLEIIGDGEYEVRSKNTAMVRVVSSLEEAYEYNVLGLRSGNTSVVIKKIGTNETLRVPTKVNEPFEISAKRDIHLVIGDMEEVVTDSDIEILNRTTYVSILSNSIDNQKTRHVIHGTRVSTDGSVELVFRRKNRPEDVVVRSVYIYQGPTLISFPSKGIDRYVGQEAVINVLKIGSELTNKEVKWSIPDELKVIGEPSQGDRSSSIKLLCLAKCKDKISALIGPVNTVITANISKPDGSNFFKHGDYYFRLKQGASPILPLQLEHDVHIHTVNGIEYRDIFHNLKSSAMNFMGRSPENRKKARIIFLDLIVSWLETRKDNEFADPAVFEAVYSKFIEKRL